MKRRTDKSVTRTNNIKVVWKYEMTFLAMSFMCFYIMLLDGSYINAIYFAPTEGYAARH